MVETVKKNDFVEISYTGRANGEIFDSNREEDLKKINPREEEKKDKEQKKTIIALGQGMIVPGLDKELEGKEVGKEYKIQVKSKDAFGFRRKELIRTIPLKMFTEKKVTPYPGMVLALDNSLVRVITVSGARVITDFNNPLASKDLEYDVKIVRKVEDDKEKIDSLFVFLMQFIPEYEIVNEKKEVILKGPRALEPFVDGFGEKFEGLIGKKLVFQEKKLDRKDGVESTLGE